MRNRANFSGLLCRDRCDVDFYGCGRCDAAVSVAGSPEALELVQSSVEAALDGGLVTGELGKSVRQIRGTDEGSTKRGGFHVSLGFHLLCPGEGFLVLLFVRYRSWSA